MDGCSHEARAVHVTEETAAELELLAGLPWEQCRMHYSPAQDGVVLDIALERSVIPADLALGWLLASKTGHGACVTDDLWERKENYRRAAECAELAVICERIQAKAIARIVDGGAVVDVYRGMTADQITQAMRNQGSNLTATQKMVQQSCTAVDGTREGARAAWGFVVEQLRTEHRGIGLRERGGQTLLDHYKRELEAMS